MKKNFLRLSSQKLYGEKRLLYTCLATEFLSFPGACKGRTKFIAISGKTENLPHMLASKRLLISPALSASKYLIIKLKTLQLP